MFGYVGRCATNSKFVILTASNGIMRSMRAIGERYGLDSPHVLNYDFTFLAMCSPLEKLSTKTSCADVCKPDSEKARLHPLPGVQLAADESVILTYHKLLDSAEDEVLSEGFPQNSVFPPIPHIGSKKERPELAKESSALLELQ